MEFYLKYVLNRLKRISRSTNGPTNGLTDDLSSPVTIPELFLSIYQTYRCSHLAFSKNVLYVYDQTHYYYYYAQKNHRNNSQNANIRRFFSFTHARTHAHTSKFINFSLLPPPPLFYPSVLYLYFLQKCSILWSTLTYLVF